MISIRSNRANRVAIKIMRLAIVVGLTAAVLAVLLYTCPGLILLLRPPPSRSPYCSLLDAVRDFPTTLKQINTEKKIAADSRLLRTDGRFELWETRDGQYWLPAGDHSILPALLAQQERNIYGDETWGVHQGDIVLDCGAHVGVYAKKALSAGAALVVAIEPTPSAVECLRRNLAEDIAAGRVIIYPKGVWDTEATLPLFKNGWNESANSFVYSLPGAKATEELPVTRIDTLVSELKLRRVDFIKQDIKGATERALVGATGAISRWKPRLAISTEEESESPESIFSLLRSIRPDYQMKCGPCLVWGEIFTDVVFFR